MINRLKICVIRSNYLRKIFLNKIRNWRFNSFLLLFVRDFRRKSYANYAVILRLVKRLLPLFNVMRNNFEIRRSLLSLSQLKMRTIRIKIIVRILAIKIPKKIILKRVNKVEEFLTRKIREKYLSIKIKMKRIFFLKIYLKSNILITEN